MEKRCAVRIEITGTRPAMTRRAALTSVSFPAGDGEAIGGEGNPPTRSVF